MGPWSHRSALPVLTGINRLAGSEIARHGAATSAGSPWNPNVARLNVLVLHRGPSDPMRRTLALRGAARLILRPRVIEGREINRLRMRRQMRPDRWRKVVDRCIGQAQGLRGTGSSNQEIAGVQSSVMIARRSRKISHPAASNNVPPIRIVTYQAAVLILRRPCRSVAVAFARGDGGS